MAADFWIPFNPTLTIPTLPYEVIAQKIYINGAADPSYIFLPRRSTTGEQFPPMQFTLEQWRLKGMLEQNGSRFI